MTTIQTIARKHTAADANHKMRVQAADIYADALKQIEGLDICLAGTLHKEAADHCEAAAAKLKALAGVMRALHNQGQSS